MSRVRRPTTSVTYQLVVWGTPVLQTLHIPPGGTMAMQASHGATARDAGAETVPDHSHHSHEH